MVSVDRILQNNGCLITILRCGALPASDITASRQKSIVLAKAYPIL